MSHLNGVHEGATQVLANTFFDFLLMFSGLLFFLWFEPSKLQINQHVARRFLAFGNIESFMKLVDMGINSKKLFTCNKTIWHRQRMETKMSHGEYL